MENSDCLECHGEDGLSTIRDGHEVSLHVSAEGYSASVHGANEINCVDCHTDASDEHPDERQDLQPVDCGSCHDGAGELFAASIHASNFKTGGRAVRCADCHGTHDILGAADPQSRIYPLNVPATCGTCHSDPGKVGVDAAVSAQYEQGRHGVATSKGMLGAAICTDCHGNHAVLAVSDSRSPANRKNIVATCGECHAGTMTAYSRSIHGIARSKGDEEAPTCADCHNPHDTRRVDKQDFQLGMVGTCGSCHHEDFITYRASYHGQITGLGFTGRMAKCVDCHGAHNILPSDNPASMMSAENRLNTCRKCHPSAREKFTGFAPHLNHHDREKFPVETVVFGLMSALLLNTFLFFSVHTLMWFIRSMFEKLKKQGPPRLGNPTGRYFLRFNYYHRVTHFLIFTSFVTLTLTGLPLKFNEYAWAQRLAHLMGGYEVCGILHRMMGAVTFGYFAMHLGYVAYLAISGKMRVRDILWGPRSIVPQPNDAVELVGNFKWFLGLGPKPKFGRFTYWEKFDYLAVFWGVALIGFSGLVLWMPELFTRLLPGEVINLAWIIHSDEALLAAGFIFLIHFYNTHLRVEKFPLDPVILTGRIDEEEMRHERPKEFALRREDGSLREIQTTRPPLWMNNFARVVGWTFVFIGFALLIAMISAFFV
ncbi:MAG: cytochrome c3 family protein [Desulfobacterales bacterium]|nr:cytochrome c3 family protein [Desulfobacterales bacterium]